MSASITVSGVVYPIPTTGDVDWGTKVNNALTALSLVVAPAPRQITLTWADPTPAAGTLLMKPAVVSAKYIVPFNCTITSLAVYDESSVAANLVYTVVVGGVDTAYVLGGGGGVPASYTTDAAVVNLVSGSDIAIRMNSDGSDPTNVTATITLTAT